EAELADVGAAGDLHVADLDVVQTVGDDLPDVLLGVDPRAGLVDIGQLDGVPDVDGPAHRLLEADDRLEEGRLPDAVGTDDTDDAVARKREGQVVDEHT